MFGEWNVEDWKVIPNEARPGIRLWLPCAAVDKQDIRQELELLKERGFGRVEITARCNQHHEIIKSEDGWPSENWNQLVTVIEDEVQRLGMKLDVTVSMSWPISIPEIQDPDNSATVHELTYGVRECSKDGYYEGNVPLRRVKHDKGTPELVGVFAYLELKNHVLKKDSYIDLMPFVEGKGEEAVVRCQLPQTDQGKWLIFAFYQQPSSEMVEGMYYVADHIGIAGEKAIEAYWRPILEENQYPSMESIFCDSMEYNTCLDWTENFEQEFERRRGYSIIPYLVCLNTGCVIPKPDSPAYVFEKDGLAEMINFDFLKTLTECYCENHLGRLSDFARKYGKTIRYQVAYNKPFEIGKSALYADIPENESDGVLTLDGLKTMSAAAHIARKKRYSYECAYEYANAYGQTYEDLMWWVKRGLMAGLNAQVMHGASYSGGYHGTLSVNGNIPRISWPGFETFRVACSNYWNRTLSIEDARGCMDTIARLNAIFMKTAKVDCAIFRESYDLAGIEESGMLYSDGGALMRSGYTYEMVSTALLQLPQAIAETIETPWGSKVVIDPDGVSYQCLIIPYQKYISKEFLQCVQSLLQSNFPIIWVGNFPNGPMYYSECKSLEEVSCWKKQLQQIWEKVIHVDTLEQIPEVLKKHDIFPATELDHAEKMITAKHVDKEKKINYYAFYYFNSKMPKNRKNIFDRKPRNGYERPGNSSRKHITVYLDSEGSVYRCNPWNGKSYPVYAVTGNHRSKCSFDIQEDDLIILAVDETNKGKNEQDGSAEADFYKDEEKWIPVQFQKVTMEKFEPNQPGEMSFLRSHYTEKKKRYQLMDGLKPWRKLDPELEAFVGRGVYEGSFEIQKIQDEERYILCLGEVSDTFQVEINGKRTDFPDQVMKTVDVTSFVHSGKNQLHVTVTGNLYNYLVGGRQNEPDLCFKIPVPYEPKDYGIYETKEKKCGVLVVKQEKHF